MYVIETTRKTEIGALRKAMLFKRAALRSISARSRERGAMVVAVLRMTLRGWAAGTLLALQAGCTSVDPGPDFVIPDETFDADYFYCEVEPKLLVAYKCGPGDPSKGDPPNSDGCHYSSAVSGMGLRMHAPVPCSGDKPTDPMSVGGGTAAQSNFEVVSFEMSRDYTTAPLYVRPLGHAHPRSIFSSSDPVVQVLRTWAAK
jgi:hypothetical protein